MSQTIEVRVPDIGDFADVPVIEVLVSPGDRVEEEQSLVTLESDKATMEIPSPAAGEILELKVEIDSTVSEGSVIAVLKAADQEESPDAGRETPASGERLQQAGGVGAKTAWALTAELPELGKLTGKQVAALAGLAPQAPGRNVLAGDETPRQQPVPGVLRIFLKPCPGGPEAKTVAPSIHVMEHP
mgnify:CR=1 FL=1